MSDLVFHELKITKRQRPKDEAAAAMVPPGPKVWVGPKTQTPFLLTPITGALQQQISVLRTRILSTMPPLGGVLLHVGIHEEKAPVAEAKPGQRLVSLEILGTGRVPSLVVFIAQSAVRNIKRAPRGWGRKSLYLWAERA